MAVPAGPLGAPGDGHRLDRRLVLLRLARQPHWRRPRTPARANAGVGGELWAVHGGGFYNAQKYTNGVPTMPGNLHWFKWEAYTTLITGAFLLALLYWYQAEVYTIDPAVMDLSKPAAVGIGLLTLVGGWLGYDALCRSRLGRSENLMAGVLVATLTVIAFALCHVFSGRGAYMHFGASCSARSWSLTSSSSSCRGQRAMVASTEGGRAARSDPRHPRQAALGPQHLLHAAGAVRHDQQPLLDAVGPRVQLGDPDRHVGGGRADPRALRARALRQADAGARGRRRAADRGRGHGHRAPPRRPDRPRRSRPSRSTRAHAIVTARCTSCHAGRAHAGGLHRAPGGASSWRRPSRPSRRPPPSTARRWSRRPCRSAT